jgi:hypothetical protein
VSSLHVYYVYCYCFNFFFLNNYQVNFSIRILLIIQLGKGSDELSLKQRAVIALQTAMKQKLKLSKDSKQYFHNHFMAFQ